MLLTSMEHDHDTMLPESRKPFTFKDASKLHQCCGAFIYFIQKLRDMAPEKEYPAMLESLQSQFIHGYLDADLLHVLECNVPPGDLAAIGSFRRPSGSLTRVTFRFVDEFLLSVAHVMHDLSQCKFLLLS